MSVYPLHLYIICIGQIKFMYLEYFRHGAF